MSATAWQFWIDRGGTFTDCLAISPDGDVRTTKVLSSDRAPLEAVERLAAEMGAGPLSQLEARVKLGTTVATNALLERRGIPTALLTNEGLVGVFDIGTQERPDLFRLEIERAARLHAWRLEIADARAGGDALDRDAVRATLEGARAEGARALAVVLMFGFDRPEAEQVCTEIARSVGFEYVVASHELAREIGFLSRGETTIADAYLTPLLRGHVETLEAGLPAAELRYMQSSGGLTDAARFRAPNALLSGPAGGIVAARRVARDAGFDRAIGFDMGGTSTDVSLIGQRLERAFESEVGGVRVKAPMLRIHTVAAGGGSLCRFDGIRLTVGPESAGSDPGPLCYALQDEAGRPRATELALTDVNLALGRVLPDRFPFPLDAAPVEAALEAMRRTLAAAGFDRDAEEIAAGFFEIANASMAQAILEVSVERGADPREHVLVGFGGAGGQHVCALAERLGMREILLHPHAGLLSAYGIGIAPASWDGQRDGHARSIDADGVFEAARESTWPSLEREGRAALHAEGLDDAMLEAEWSLDLAYAGTDTALSIERPAAAATTPRDEAVIWRRAFEAEHRLRFGYVREAARIEVRSLRVRVRGPEGGTPEVEGPASVGPARPLRHHDAWFPGVGRVSAPVYAREQLAPGARLDGPALVLEATGTVVLDPGFRLEVERGGVFRLRAPAARAASHDVALDEADPVRLEVLGNRFMSIAEQMGAVLRNTSVSTNIKERLDYSCAVFDRDGGLVANAPHIPVHLGAMADTVAAIRARFPGLAPGDVFVTNDPFAGGSHLPDVTVVTPVFLGTADAPSFFVASRGHHADLGGRTPGSMPADSTTLEEEGVLIEAFPLVRGGVFDEARIRDVLGSGRWPVRRIEDNLADLEAMVAANRAGAALLDALVREWGEEPVQITMHQLQRAAAEKVARELARFEPGLHRFADALDDGTRIVVSLAIERGEAGATLPARMRIDFSGTDAAVAGNLNAPSAVVRAAVIYVLRSLVEERIPLNGGCLDPVEIVIPEGSVLDPPPGSAVVGGNVETSQRVVDVLLGALGRAAASQGTMNNVTFGNDDFGYYETLGGGAGATGRAPGASGVHTHMTNTRITDPELLEDRFPVELLRFALRPGSGGAGRFAGGDGLERCYRFRAPVRVSLLTERRERAPFGLEGGAPGQPGRNRVWRAATGVAEVVPGRASLALDAGDELWIETPGGGGFGAPGAAETPRSS